MKNNKTIISLLVTTIIFLLILVLLMFIGVIKLPNTNADEIKINTIDKSKLDTSKLSSSNSIDNSILQKVTITNYSNNKFSEYDVQINLNGKVHVYGNDNYSNYSDGELNNISNAVQVIEFNIPSSSDDQLCYILLSNGDVYYYRVGDIFSKSLDATKVENMKNVKRLFVYSHEQTWEIIAIDENNTLVSLKKESV